MIRPSSVTRVRICRWVSLDTMLSPPLCPSAALPALADSRFPHWLRLCGLAGVSPVSVIPFRHAPASALSDAGWWHPCRFAATSFRKTRCRRQIPLAAARDPVDRNRRTEIIRNTLALFFGCCVQQPHQQKKSHHRRHEIGVSDFPGTPMMPAAGDDLFPFDDDWRDIALTRSSPPPIYSPDARGSRARVTPVLTNKLVLKLSLRTASACR